MNATIRLNRKFCDAIRVEARTDFVDPTESGLYLRVTPTGVKTWSFVYRQPGSGAKKRKTLGGYPALLPDDARKAAREAKRLLDRGDDPGAARAARISVRTFKDLATLYIERHAKPNKRSWARDQEYLDRDILPVLGGLLVERITRSDVLRIMDRVEARGGSVQKERVFACVRGIFRWGLAEDFIENDPTRGMKRSAKRIIRTRVLSPSEITAFWRGIEGRGLDHKTALALKLTLVTGQRISEVTGMERSELDLERRVWVIPSSRTKNRQDHEVPLSPLALSIIEDALAHTAGKRFVFASRPRRRSDAPMAETALTGHAAARALNRNIDKLECEGEAYTPHDFRRTVATFLQREGFPEAVVARLLNHSSDTARTVTSAVYMRHAFTEEKRQAAERWADILEELGGADRDGG